MRLPVTHPRRGAAAVEFAVILPLLLFMVVGLWEVGRLIQISQVVSNAAREGGIIVVIADSVRSAHICRHGLIVIHQDFKHFSRGNEVILIVFDRWMNSCAGSRVIATRSSSSF